MNYIEESRVIRNEYGTPVEQQKVRVPSNNRPTTSSIDLEPTSQSVNSMRIDRNNTPAMQAYKQQVADNKAIVEDMKVNKERMLREGYTPDQLENTVDTIKQAKRFVKSVESKHESIIDIVKGLKNKSLGQAERMKYAEMIRNAEKRGLIKTTKTPEGEPAIIDINGKITKMEDLEDGFLASMGYLLLDSPAALVTGIVGAIPVARAIGTAAKAAAVSKPGQYMLQVAGFSGASSVGTMLDDKLLQAKRDRYLKNPVFKDLIESQPGQDNFEDSFSAVVTFDRKKAQADFSKLNNHIDTLGSIQSMLDAGSKDIINNMALTPIIDGILGGGKYAVKSATPYVTAGAKWVGKQAPAAAAGATSGSILTAGLSAIGVPFPVAAGAGAVTGAITRNKIKAGQDFVASGISKATEIGKETIKNKNVDEVFNNAKAQVGNVLKKKNADPAYSIDGYLKQYYGEMFNDPSVLPTLVNKLGSFGVKLDINNNTDKALAVMLMSPNAPQFIKVMVNDNPAAGVAIRDMLIAFSKAFDYQIKNMLPANKQMSVATFASDLKTMQTNNIAALNELAKYGNKLTNNKVVSGVSANEYRDAIRNYADGKQLVNSGLPSKLSNRKKNIAAHKEDGQNLFTRFATLNDTEAKAVSEKGLLKGANFEDLVTMKANLAVIDDETILAAPSIANLRIAIDQGLEEVLAHVGDSASRDALRNQMQQVVNKIHAFEKLGNNKLLGAIMKENNPDAILKHFTDMMQEIQILDNASAIKQVMSILPTQKRAQLETLIINKIIEDVTDNLTTPGKLVINSAKLRGFISKVESQFATNEGKALLSILKDYAEVFGDTAALMKAATTKSTKTGPSGGIGHNLFNKFRVYMAGKLFRNLIGYLGPGHSSSTFRLSNILAKRLRDPLDPNIAKAVDNLYSARLAMYKNAKTPEAAAAAKADIDAIKEANSLASEVNAMNQKINANAAMIQNMEVSLKQQGINEAQAEKIIGEQLGIPSKETVETPSMQIVPISEMKNLVNLNVNKLLQIEPELVKAMENDLYKRITSEAIEIAENLALNNKQFNIKDFINTIIYRYNQVLPNNKQSHALQEISEQDLKPIVEATTAQREEARKVYEAEKAAAYEAEQAEKAAQAEKEAIANQEKEAAEQAERDARIKAEEEAAIKREAENAEAKAAAEAEKEKKKELAKEKAKEKRKEKKEKKAALEEKLAKMEEKAADAAEKQVARDANIEKLQEEGVKLAEQVTKETNEKIVRGETEPIFNQNLGVKFGFIKDGKTFKQSISTDKMLNWKERDKFAMQANDEYFAKNLDIKSVAENAKKILADSKIPTDEKANVRQFIRDLESILPLDKFKQLNELITGKSALEKKILVAQPTPIDYKRIKKLIKFPYGEKQIDKLTAAVEIDKAIMSAKKLGKTHYRDWVNSVIYDISPSWRLDTDLFFNKALGASAGADSINKHFGMKVISDEVKSKIEHRLKNRSIKDPFLAIEFQKLYYGATGIEQVYIQRNIPRIIINDAKAAGINFNKFVTDKNGDPVIIYRGVNSDVDETGFPIDLMPEELYDRAISLDKPYKFTGEDPSKFIGPREEAPRYIMRNALYTSKSINHSLHFARNNLAGLGHFFLRADAKILNKSMSGEPFGRGNKYVKELYNKEYADAIYYNQEGESIRKKLVSSDAVALSDDTLVVFNEEALVHPITMDSTTKFEPLKPVVFYNHGGAVGAIAGIEQNEDGSYSFNVERALLGMALGYGIHQTAPKLQTTAHNLMQNDKFMQLIKTMLSLPNDKNKPSPALMKANIAPTKIMRDELNRVNIAFMIGGENAVREPTKLPKAKRLKEQGADDLSIYRETGWRFNNAQGKWKFDFDAKANWIDEKHILNLFNKFKKTIDGIASIPLGELIPKAKTLFKYYPTIKNTVAIIGEKDNPTLAAELDGAVAAYSRMDAFADGRSRIFIPIEELKENKTSLQHEVQHNIQELERYIGKEDYEVPGFADIVSYISKGNFYNDVPMKLHDLLPDNVVDYLLEAQVKDKNKWLAKLKIMPTASAAVYGINPKIIGINPDIIKTDKALQQILLAAAVYKNIPLDKIAYYMRLIEQEARYVEYATISAREGLSPTMPIDLNPNANKLMDETRVIR